MAGASEKGKPRKADLIKDMYSILTASVVELERVESITSELFQIEEDKNKQAQLVLMGSEIRKYRMKFKKMTDGMFDKYFNIVELAKRKQNQKTEPRLLTKTKDEA